MYGEREVIINNSGVVSTPCTPGPTFDIASKVGKRSSPTLPLTPLPEACSKLELTIPCVRAPRLTSLQVETGLITQGHAKRMTYTGPARSRADINGTNVFCLWPYGVPVRDCSGREIAGRRDAERVKQSHHRAPESMPPYMSLPPRPPYAKGGLRGEDGRGVTGLEK